MKKIYTYLFSLLVLSSVNAGATVWQVQVNDGSFSPNNLPNVVCGDTILWTLNSILPHTTTSTTIPSGATPWNSPINTSTPAFPYFVPNFAGVYNYICTPHGFTGSFTVTCSVGIDKAEASSALSVSPNPFTTSITLINHHADAVRITDMTGRIIKAISLNASADRSGINLEAFAPGIYFVTTSKEGVIQETKRIIKAK